MANNEQPTLLGVYLVVGEDELKRRTVIDRLRKRVSDAGELEFNHDEFDGERASGADIVAACNTLPFASELRLVEVANVDKLSKADSEALVDYLGQRCASTVLALSASKLAKNTRLFKAVQGIDAKAVIDCAPMKRFELVRALRSMAVGHGFSITQGAAEKLVELIGEDTVALDSELQKLALACGGTDAVTDRDVARLVARTTEAKPWELVDAFAARDARQCAALLGQLSSSSPHALIAMCTTRLRELACAKSLESRGEVGRLAEVLKVPSWRVKHHRTWASRFTEAELVRAFSTSRDYERAMKSGVDADDAFREWLFATIAR